jgi:hypothetical protein
MTISPTPEEPPIVPPPVVVPEAPPIGSSATDVDAIIPSILLTYLTNSAKSLLLSAGNIGASTLTKIETALEVIDNLARLTIYEIDGTPLDSLANGSTSSSFVVSNVGTSTFVRINVLLGEFQPSSGGKVIISDGTTAYQLEVGNFLSEKRVEFNNIPASFVSSFTVKNSTGVTFPSYGNSIVVTPL